MFNTLNVEKFSFKNFIPCNKTRCQSWWGLLYRVVACQNPPDLQPVANKSSSASVLIQIPHATRSRPWCLVTLGCGFSVSYSNSTRTVRWWTCLLALDSYSTRTDASVPRSWCWSRTEDEPLLWLVDINTINSPSRLISMTRSSKLSQWLWEQIAESET